MGVLTPDMCSCIPVMSCRNKWSYFLAKGAYNKYTRHNVDYSNIQKYPLVEESSDFIEITFLYNAVNYKKISFI